MTLLPLLPLFMAAAVGIANTAPAEPVPSRQPAPAARRAVAETGWQELLIQGAAPVFHRPDGPLRG